MKKTNIILCYIIYEYISPCEGDIYMYFSKGYNEFTKISAFYNLNDIKIYESGKISGYIEQKSIYREPYSKFKSHIGKIYFAISNFITDFSDTIHIINNNEYFNIKNN